MFSVHAVIGYVIISVAIPMSSNCVSLNVKISYKLASIAAIMIDIDFAKVMSAISSTRKKNRSPNVR